jgi:Amt family ammonium transporter
VFATKTVNPAGADGLLAGNAGLVWVQLLAVLGTMAFSAVATAGNLVLVRAVQPLRVSLDTELAGVDVAEHGEHAYHGGLGELTGGRAPLGDGVLVAAHEIAPPLARPATAA